MTGKFYFKINKHWGNSRLQSNEAKLKKLGATKVYQCLSEKNPDQHLPVCYYL